MNTEITEPDSLFGYLEDISVTLRLRYDFISERQFNETSMHLDVELPGGLTSTLFLQLMPHRQILISFDGTLLQATSINEALQIIYILLEDARETF
ncbi:MAG: hypothetical protein QXN55_01045 [Candidatus Nitrosotenuis sp.]